MKEPIIKHSLILFETYRGDQPLADFIRAYFRAHPHLGSRDRRWIRENVHQLFRWGKGFESTLPLRSRLWASLFLSSPWSADTASFLPPNWQEHHRSSLPEKCAFLARQGIQYDPQMGWDHRLNFSSSLNLSTWMQYLQRSPQVFLRVLRENDQVKQALKKAGIDWMEVDTHTLALDQDRPIDQIIPPSWYRIQDASSQACGDFFAAAPGEKWWDCCAGAGGKSMLLIEKEPRVQLWVSDPRRKSIESLRQRWKTGGYPPFHASYTGSVSKLIAEQNLPVFDHIIADLPCSGSGTWSRTPASFYHFSPKIIPSLQKQQREICEAALCQLKPGGIFYYITCSVFEEENEAIVAEIQKQGLTCIDQQIVHRSPFAADYLFVARLRKNN